MFTKVTNLHYEGDDLLEQGVMAEFDGSPKPELFKTALGKFEETGTQIDAVAAKLDELIAIHKAGKLTREFEMALNKILSESRDDERVTLAWRRYANVAREGQPRIGSKPPRNLLAVMQAQKADLAVLRKQLDDTIQAFRTVIPYAERGEFAAMMLSGRHGFADKIQQSVDLLQVFGRFYTSKCMATIAATMHAYPAGLAWLRDSERGRK